MSIGRLRLRINEPKISSEMEISYNYVVIEGNIGAGKTTLATRISEQFNARLILERFADNPFLPKFYDDPEKYSFPLELSFLASRYKQLKEELVPQDLFKSFTVADYYFMKSLVFASSTLKGDEYNLYRQIYHIIYSSLPKPDIYVYLHLTTENLLRNIKKRGRNYEKTITAEYLQKIQESYFTFFRQNPENRYLVIDINGIDFVAHEEDYKKLVDAIFYREYQVGLNTLIL
ncbi:MAG: deoxynucleoside kinase [Bacteroidales bacterium]|jgi:deoxyadenosine/deoxycytidine kinase|nr:deoxynucleoside kinase [Bacteroidales bacterium]NMD04157.1 deoxynucleoside kinase [Bacteroidales bacterium]OQB59909.1 MAG: Deoxyguanosine kinase [Bacteroidetes bacterium ADurb.Bin145]HOU03116.1 deoxynucleoside kinase [Bacteroidales bacterium]HQK69043.1 deoxynucleoside kinase [Bacteroidales bacterium]